MKKMLIVLALILSVPFLGQTAEITDGLVLYMPLDEGTGKKVKDLSGTKAEGELKGGKWVDGKFGKALQFKAAQEKVVVEDNKAFHIEGAITQAAWVQLDQLPSAHAIVFGTRSGGGRNIGFGYGMNPGNGLKVWTNDKGGGFKDINDNKTKLKTGTWYYLAYTHTDDDKGMVKIYVDGKVTYEEKSGNPVAPAGAPDAVQIGTWNGEKWPGIVDEVRMWNRALSAEEIQFSMEAGEEKFMAVQPTAKLAATWGRLKVQ